MTALKDDKNFRSLDSGRWEDLCFLLFKEEYPDLQRVDGSGGDEGIDAYVGTYDNPTLVFQFKFFSKGFGFKQVSQIRRSLDKVCENRSNFKWILVCSAEPTPKARRALDGLKVDYPDISIEFICEGDVKSRLSKCPTVRRTFYDDGMETLKSIIRLDEMNPLDKARKGVSLYNESIVDERFHVTVTTDGNSMIESYSLNPNFSGPMPTVSVKFSSDKAVESYNKLIRYGAPLELAGNDVKVENRGFPGIDEGELELLKIVPQHDPRPTQLRFYSSDKLDKYQALFVELQTVQEGTESIVRSNVHQKNAPIWFQFVLSKDAAKDGSRNKSTLSVTPCYLGNRISVVHKGALFLAQLAETGQLGISGADEDLKDAHFFSLNGIKDNDIWKNQLSYIDAIDRVCRFFSIDPKVNETLSSIELFNQIRYLDTKITNPGVEIEGTVGFTFEKINPSLYEFADKQKESSFVADFDWLGSIFNSTLTAKIRIVITGVPSIKATDEGKVSVAIKGRYRSYIQRISDKKIDN